MNIDEARFKVLEQNVQALQQTCYQILVRLTDLKIVLAGKGLLVHPEEKSDIPEHSLFAQVKRVIEKENAEKELIQDFLRREFSTGLGGTATGVEESTVYPYSHNTVCPCDMCSRNRQRKSCTGDYYGPL